MKIENEFFKTALRQAVLITLISVLIGMAFNQFRTNNLVLVGDWSAEARMSSPEGKSLTISLEEAKALHESGKALFLDARPGVWYEMGHIKGSRNIPAEQFEALYEQWLNSVVKETPIITYCDGNMCELSHELALALLEKGFSDVRVLINGWTLWSEAELPVEGSGS